MKSLDSKLTLSRYHGEFGLPGERMQSLSGQLLQKRRRFVGWLNAGLFAFSTVLLLAVALSAWRDLDVGVVAFVGAYCVAHIVGGVGCALGKRWGTLVLWPVAIIDLVAVPVGTLLGGYTLYILNETREQVGIAGRTLVVASVIPALLLALAIADRFSSNSTGSPVADSFLDAIAAQGGTREFRQWLRTLPKDSVRIAMATARLEAKGLLHLDTAAQLTHLHLIDEGLESISIHDCASLGRGVPTWQQQHAFTAGFDSAGLAAWMEIRARAILAELRDSTPSAPASESDLHDYAMFVYRSLSPHDQRRYQALAGSVASAPDSDVCWLTRLFNSRALEPDPSRSRWVRVLTSQAANQYP